MNAETELTSDIDRISRFAHRPTDSSLRPSLMRIAQQARERIANHSLQASSDFFRKISQIQVRLKGTANAEWRLDTLFNCCFYLFLMDDAEAAVDMAKYGVRLSRQSARKEDLRRFLNIQGILQSECGREMEAIESYSESLSLAQELEHSHAEFGTLVNLSSVFVNFGLYIEAIGCARHALVVAKHSRSLVVDEGAALTNIALALYYLGDQRQACEYAYRAVADGNDSSDNAIAMSRIAREQNLAMILVKLGRYKEARARCSIIENLVLRVSSHRARAIAMIANGVVEVHCGDSMKGLAMLREAASDAKARNSPIRSDALSALAAALSALERPEEALEVIRELRKHVEGVRMLNVVRAVGISEAFQSVESPAFFSNDREHRLTEATLQTRVAEREVIRTRQEMFERMAVAADIREDISGEHGYRVGRLSSMLAKEIGWERDACDDLDISARLHDIGKFGIPDRILLDKGTLREAEKHFIESHTLVGAEILSRSEIPQVRIAEEIARCHHEWWDGSGYPRGLMGAGIPKGARIVALADSFDAMTHGRPYAKPISVEAALDQIAGLRGRQFDPELTDHFLALVRRLTASYKDLDAYLGKAARNSPFLKARAKIKELLAQSHEAYGLFSDPPPPGTTVN